MRPQQFKPLFSKKEPKVSYQEGFLALPTRAMSSFRLPPWEEVFENRNPVIIEYCSGNGHWIAQQAIDHPETNWVAVEWQFDRARRIYSKRHNLGLKNFLVVCGEALRFTKEHVDSRSIAKAYVHFPDPWPKRKHTKRRLMQPPFLNELARVMVPEGEVVLVTDDRPYLDEAISHFRALPGWSSSLPSPYFTETTDYGYSTFAELWSNLGRVFLKTSFIRRDERPRILPSGGNVRSVVLNCSSRSTLKWQIEPGLPALWELRTDLFDHPEDEMAVRSFELAIDHVIDHVLPHYPTFGVLLYKGKGEAPAPLLRSLAARLPDGITPYIALDLSDVTGGKFFQTLQREELPHFGLILKGGNAPYAVEAIGWGQPSPYGIYESGELLPPIEIKTALCHGPEGDFTLPNEVCRVIPEALLTDEWNGIDTLFVVHPTPMGLRKVAGFAATGGEVIEIQDDGSSPQLQETSHPSSLVASL